LLNKTAIMLTAWRRPFYLEPVLESWAKACAICPPARFVIALGRTDRTAAMSDVITRMRPHFPVPLEVLPQAHRAVLSNGPHRAIGEAISAIFRDDPGIGFVVSGEEDVAVSDDVLAYMAWARDQFAGMPDVLAALAHNRHGQAWDNPPPPQDPAADPRNIRLVPYFNPWIWGTWRERWEHFLEPHWDWECDSGGPMDSGYDWNVQLRILPEYGMRCLVPDASRSQNTGQHEGWAGSSDPAWFAQTQTATFRARRGKVAYRLVTDESVPPVAPVTAAPAPPVTDPGGAALWDGLSGALAFDVGAHRGESIPFMASRYSRVVSFEPWPESYAAAAAVPGADVRQVAISDHAGKVTLFLSGAQLTSPGHEVWERDDIAGAEQVAVPCLTLDEIAAAEGLPDLVKVDTEGHEAAVLRGAAGVLAAGRASWLTEFHSAGLRQECAAILEAAGYSVETVRHPHYPEGSRLWHQHGWLRAFPPGGGSPCAS